MRGLCIFFLLLPTVVLAQNFYELPASASASAAARLFQIQKHTVLIQPVDLLNREHTWTTFDSLLVPLTTKKLVTPGAENLFSQTYIEGSQNIIRVDQFVIDGELRISAFVFDANGKIIRSKEIEASSAQGGFLLPTPMYVSQSPDKNVLILTQQVVEGEDSLGLVYFVTDVDLNVLQSGKFMVPFNPVVTEVLMPVVSNAGNFCFVLSEKYNSYRLGTTIECYLSHVQTGLQTFSFTLERKKARNLHVDLGEENLHFTALFKTERESDDLSGIVTGIYDLRRKKLLPVTEQLFDPKLQKELRRNFSAGRRNGNPYQYLALFPVSDFSTTHRFAFILPEQKDSRIQLSDKSTPPPPSLTAIQQNISYVRSLVGTQPPGYNKPMNEAEASAYAALKQQNATSQINSVEQERTKGGNGRYPTTDNGLLLFGLDSNRQITYKLARLKRVAQPGYEFFSYSPDTAGFSALHYKIKGLEHPAFFATTLDIKGNIREKPLLKDRFRLLLPEYDFLVAAGYLIAFYENKKTQRIGILKVKL